jgi:hypothetical protein
MLRSTVGRAVPGLALAAALSAGCITTSSFSSPNVLPEDGVAYVIGAKAVSEVGVGGPIMAVRWGMGDGLELTGGMEMATLTFGARYQFLRSEQHFVDAAIEAGMGMLAFILPTYYVGVGLGFDLGSPESGIAPYVNYRWTGLSLIDTTDLTDSDSNDDFDIDTIDGWGQVTVGVELRLSEKFALIPEVSWIQDLEGSTGETLMTYGVAIRISKF